MSKIKPIKPIKQAHTPKSQIGMGDYYGTGVKNKVGRVREIIGTDKISNKKLGKPPKSLA